MNIDEEREKNVLRRARHDASGKPKLALIRDEIVPVLWCGRPCGPPIFKVLPGCNPKLAEWLVHSIQDNTCDVIDELLGGVGK